MHILVLDFKAHKVLPDLQSNRKHSSSEIPVDFE